MTGIENLDGVLTLMKADGNALMARYADEVDHAVKQFLESKRNFYCTNTDCPLKKALREVVK